jgi:hypothetical protein
MIRGSGSLRTQLARLAMVTGILCGLMGVLAGAQDVVWKFGSTGWFTGGSLLTLLAIFELIDGALARQRFDLRPHPVDLQPAEDTALDKPVWRPPSPPR